MAYRQRRGGGLTDFIQGFRQGYDSFNQMGADWGLADVEKAAPEEVYNYATSDLNAVGPQQPGQEDQQMQGGPSVKYKLLGKEQDTPFTQDQINEAKAGARASVYRKFGQSEQARREEEGLDAMRTRALQRQQAQQSLDIGAEQLKTAKREGAKADQKANVDSRLAANFQAKLTDPNSGEQRAPTPAEMSQFQADAAKEYAKAGLMQESAQAYAQWAQNAKAQLEATTAQRTEAANQAIAAVRSGDLQALGRYYDTQIPDGGKVTGVTQDKKGNTVIQSVDASGKARQPLTIPGGTEGAVNAIMMTVKPDFAFELTKRGLELKQIEAHIAASKASSGASAAAAEASRAGVKRADADQRMQEEKFGWERQKHNMEERYVGIQAKDPSQRTPEENQFLKAFEARVKVGRNEAGQYVFHDMKDVTGATTGITRGNTHTGEIVNIPTNSMPGLSSVSGGAPAAAPAAAPPPAQRKVGQTYQTPKGPLVWMGNGWAMPTK